MKKLTMTLSTLALCLLGAGSAVAAGYPWKNHARPYDFLFENDIDTHQQTRETKRGDLLGFFYIHYTGVKTSDGYRVATHVDCNAHMADCKVGWQLNGKPTTTATFLYHSVDDHPVWLVDRADIPQPGAYAHFHWLGDHPTPEDPDRAGYLLQLTAVDTFCFIHHMADAASGDETCRDNGGIAVSVGIDIATHLNIVTSYE
jgi:hypothetical protein